MSLPHGVTLLSQGAEGRLYRTTWLGRDVVVKQRFPKYYRHPELDSHITRERLKAEARSLVRCRMIGIRVPALYDINLASSEIILEYLSKTITVRNALSGCCSQLELQLKLAYVIGYILQKLHSNDIIHGDLTTSNMLLFQPSSIEEDISADQPLVEVFSTEEPLVYLIDFGLSYVSEQTEDKAVDLYVFERAVLSTHPNSEAFWERILRIYKEGGKKFSEVIAKLDDVRSRGRKKLCFG